MASASTPGADLWIANTVADLIQGDINEHLPLERIPLQGDVLGLGTTTSFDNGELTFLLNPSGNTTIWKCQASDAGIRPLHPGEGSSHFPYVCFSGDVSAQKVLVDPAELGAVQGEPLQQLVGSTIARLVAAGRLPAAPVYGLRLQLEWQSLVITVASKLCMGQQRRNAALATSAASDGTASRSIYDLLQHYRLAEADPADPEDPIRYLGQALHWECCGFYDTEPSTGRVTVPQGDDHLHLHGCSIDLRHGGHLHHGHPGTSLKAVQRFAVYPLQQLHWLASDLAIENLRYDNGSALFRVVNRGAMDVSDVGVAVVIDDRYSDHRYLRLPWLAAGGSEDFNLPVPLPRGEHRLEVIADPQRQIIESTATQSNNCARLDLVIA